MNKKNQNQKTEIKALTVRIPQELHRNARIKFFEKGISFQRFFITKLNEFVRDKA